MAKPKLETDILEISAVEFMDQIKKYQKDMGEGFDAETHMRLKIDKIYYRKNSHVWKLRPVYDPSAARKKLKIAEKVE